MLTGIVSTLANTLRESPDLTFAGEVHAVELDGVDYEVTITLTRSGQLDFHSMYLKERDK